MDVGEIQQIMILSKTIEWKINPILGDNSSDQEYGTMNRLCPDEYFYSTLFF